MKKLCLHIWQQQGSYERCLKCGAERPLTYKTNFGRRLKVRFKR